MRVNEKGRQAAGVEGNTVWGRRRNSEGKYRTEGNSEGEGSGLEGEDKS